MIANTGWTWEEVGRLTMPRLKALNRYWVKHPPVHMLVAAYLGYEAPPERAPRRQSSEPTDDGPIIPRQTPWMNGMGAIPASDELRNASTPMDALAALERTFFGTLVER